MMFELRTLDDLSTLAESVELECKLAQGQDGKGELPKEFWITYSAMANAHGGVVLLGVREKQGVFSVAGIEKAAKVRADLFSMLVNAEKVSVNLLTDADVQEHVVDGKTVLAVHIPAASRKQKPVYLNGQPLANTYRRLNDGDRRCDDETVKRMLVEQIEDDRDQRILPNFGMADIDLESLRVYRQMLRDEKPGHPFLEFDDEEFLRQVGGWRRDRESGVYGLTLAGLLMFGRWSAIQEAVPHYFVDYQERPEARTEKRWIDRLVPDGTWSGNVFDFYRRVYRKLVTDLKVPFAVRDGQRQDDTPVHQALREAFVNALVHADYTGRVSILVVKRPDMFGFRNPGGLRLPLEQVIQGGESDCRNRLMHQMFLMIGLGERAGSGMPKIYSGWRSQHWRSPALVEKDEPEQTQLALQMVDLLPNDVLEQLRLRFGAKFDSLSNDGRLVLATAVIERVVKHSRLLELCEAHPHDLTLLLARLVKEGFLASDGRSRGMVYHLPGESLPTPDQVFEGPLPLSSTHIEPSSTHLPVSSTHLPPSSTYLGGGDQPRDANGCRLSPHLDAPLIDELKELSPGFLTALEQQAIEPRTKGKLSALVMQQVILSLCHGRFLMIGPLAALVDRNPNALRQQYLNAMVKAGKIELAFPSKPTHERQAYRTVVPKNG
jgi:predicted HTH transcriptional regulator